MEKQIQLKLRIPYNRFQRSMRFNRYAIEILGNDRILHFGLLGGTGGLYDRYSCILENIDWQNQKDRLLTFLPKLGDIKSKPVPWTAPAPSPADHIDVVRFIHMAQLGNSAEIIMCNAGVGGVLGTGTVEIEPDAVAMLTCELELLKVFLTELYPNA